MLDTISQSLLNEVKATLNETNEGVKHDRYVRSHGKKASGRAQWMFTTKRMGDVDYDNPNEFYRHNKNTTLSDAATAAAKALGTREVYVMESTQRDKE